MSLLFFLAALAATSVTEVPAPKVDGAYIKREGGLVAAPILKGEGAESAGDPVYVTYRQACIEGWAARPTNDCQRAVWKAVAEERRKGPRNPVRIFPGQKPARKQVKKSAD